MSFKRVFFNVLIIFLGLMLMGGCPPEPDDNVPEIILNGESSITLTQGTSYVELGATATDKEDGEVKVTISGSVDSSKVGVYTITYTAIDSDGNKVTKNRIVKVIKNSVDEIQSTFQISNIRNTTLELDYICRPNDEMEIIGSKLYQDNVNLNFIEKNGTVIKVEPLYLKDKSITFECPQLSDGLKKFNIEYKDKHSSFYNIQFLKKSSPIINELDLDDRILTIGGKNLNKSFILHINKQNININNINGDDDTIVDIELPQNLTSSYIYLENNNSISNKKYLNIQSDIHGEVKLLKSIKKGDITIFSQENESTIDSNGNFDMKINKRSSYNIIFTERAGHSYYSSIIFSENENIILNSLSTSISLVWINLYLNGLDKEELKSLRSELYKLEEIKSLADFIEKRLNIDPYYLDKEDKELENKIDIALIKSFNLLKSFKSEIEKTTFSKTNTQSITVTPSKHQGISFKEQNNDSGNLILVNDTAVPLSLKVTNTRGEVLLSHITNSWGLGSYSGQDVFSFAGETPLNVPNGQDCSIEVLTAGSDDVFEPIENEVIGSLRRKLVLDVIWGYIGNILPSSFSKGNFISIISNPDFFDEISQGNYTKAKDIAEKNLRLYASGELIEEELKKPLNRALQKFPLLKLGQHLSQIYDYYTIDSKINFKVEFPIRIESITPNKLLINQTTEDELLHFNIKGTGLNYNLNLVLFEKGKENIEPNTIDLYILSIIDNEMEIGVRLKFLRHFFDEHLDPTKSMTRIMLSLRVSNQSAFDNEDSNSFELDNIIEVSNDLSISTVTPQKAVGGDEIVLHGTGFLEEASENTVALGHTKDGKFEVKYYLEVKEVIKFNGSDDKVTLKIPENVELGTYELRANTFDSIHWSNSINFEIKVYGAPFITTWKVVKNQGITIQIDNNLEYNYSIDWGDGTVITGVKKNITHKYLKEGISTIKIFGQFPHFISLGSGNLVSIEQWGDINWTSMESSFYSSSQLMINAKDTPNLSNVNSMRDMFAYSCCLNVKNSNWDVSNIIDMSSMFYHAQYFNLNITNWNISNVTNMYKMFGGVEDFNQDISNWNVSNVTNMSEMFSWTRFFNQDIGNWDVSNVTNMYKMFTGAETFNQDIGNWDVSNVNNMDWMFATTKSFSQDLSKWDVSKVTTYQHFSWATASRIKQPIWK